MMKNQIVFAMVIILVTLAINTNAAVVVVDFDEGPEGDFELYEEDGFRLLPTDNGGDTAFRQVRITDFAITPTLVAFPSFGFEEQDILVYSIAGYPFDFLSLEVLEGQGTFFTVQTLLVEGIRDGSIVASHVITTDGIGGAETFNLNGFTNLDLVRLGGGSSTEAAVVDNLTLNLIPEPATALLLALGGLSLLRKRK